MKIIRKSNWKVKLVFSICIMLLIMVLFIKPVYAETAYTPDGDIYFVHSPDGNDSIPEGTSKDVAPKVAVLFGMADYDCSGEAWPYGNNDLSGPPNDVMGMKEILEIDGYVVHDYMDRTKSQMLSAISSAISGMPSDGTLLFYYSGHGSKGFLNAVDTWYGGNLSIAELESALDSYDGNRVVLIDACFSGTFINKDMTTIESVSTPEEFNQSVIDVFAAADLENSKDLDKYGYKVLTASSGKQTSQENAYTVSEPPITSVFGAANYINGWDGHNYYPDLYWLGMFTTGYVDGVGLYENTYCSTLWADVYGNGNGSVDLNEMYLYIKAVLTSLSQDIQVYPVNDYFTIFGEEANFEYYSNGDGTATITGYHGYSQELVIPETIDGLTITDIASRAFDDEPFTSILLPTTLETIGDSAFSGCYNLQSISIPAGVLSIGDSAFSGCDIDTISIPSSVTSIGQNPFNQSMGLVEIFVDPANPNYKSVSGVLFTKNGQRLISYPVGNSRNSYTIPDGVEIIGAYAFDTAWHLSYLTPPSSLNTIEIWGISQTNILTFDVGINVNTIQEGAFFHNWVLRKINVDHSNASYKDIDGVLFTSDGTVLQYYPGGKSGSAYNVPNTVTRIGEYAFGGFGIPLSSIELHEGLESVGFWSFAGTDIVNFDMPKSLEEIGPGAFCYNGKLKTMSIWPNTTDIGWMEGSSFNDSVNDNIFRGGKKPVISCVEGSKAAEYAIRCGIKTKYVVDPLSEGSVTAVYSGLSYRQIYEQVDFLVTINDIPSGETAEYQLMHSKNGGKSWKATNQLWTTYSSPTTVSWILPKSSKDVNYKFKVQARTIGSGIARFSDITQIMAYPVVPQDSVELTSVGDDQPTQIMTGITIQLSALAQDKAGYDETPEYRFSYRKQGSTKWIPVTKSFGLSNIVNFAPKDEGVYYFKVEAKSLGRKKTDVIDMDVMAYRLYFVKAPVKSVYDFEPVDKDCVNLTPVDLNFSIIKNDSNEDVEYQIMLSTNGKSFKVLEGYDWQLTPPNTIDMPIVNKDTVYYIKLNVRTDGREGVDAYNITQVEMQIAEPLESVTLDAVGDDTDNQLIGLNGITLEASAVGDNPLYKFYYRLKGSTKWSPVNKSFNALDTIQFKPKKEGKYFIKVEAVSDGRKGVDVKDESTSSYNLYYTKLAAKNVGFTVSPEDQYINGDTLEVTFEVEKNDAGDDVEYQVTYSTNNKKFKVLPNHDWKPVTSPSSTVEDVLLDLPLVTKDTNFWIRVNVRTIGRQGVDEYATRETKMHVNDLPIEDMMVGYGSPKRKYLLHEREVDVYIDIEPNVDASTDETEWQVMYSTNGKSYKELPGFGWSYFANGDHDETKHVTLPISKKDTHYWIKVNGRTAGRNVADLSDEIEVDVYVVMPLENGSVSFDNVDLSMLDAYGLVKLEASGPTNAAFRFGYRPYGTSKWKYIYPKFVLGDSGDGTITTNKIKKEGYYEFIVEATANGRKKMDDSDESSTTGIFFEKESASIEDFIIDQSKYLYGEDVLAYIELDDIDDESCEYQILYSVDGRKWSMLEDWTTYAGIITDKVLDLPISTGAVKYYVKLNARTIGRTTIDDTVIDTTDLYNIMPVKNVSLTSTPSGDEYVTLEATINAESGYDSKTTPLYKYYYRIIGGKVKTWTAFTSFITNDTTTFKPTVTGDYEFRVEAVNKGRLGYDASDEDSNVGAGYFIKVVDEMMNPIIEPMPSEEPIEEVQDEAVEEPTSEEVVTSLDFANAFLLEALIEQDIAAEAVMGVQNIEEFYGVEIIAVDGLSEETVVPSIVKFADETYAVITGLEIDGESGVITLNLLSKDGEFTVSGTGDIVECWYYALIKDEQPAEVQNSPEPTEEPSEEADGEPIEQTVEDGDIEVIEEEPSPEPSELPLAS